MADFYDISSWNDKPWYQTGGTRNKVIVENPSNQKDYYFKTSLKRKQKDYKYEFWSEIIASEVGRFLGFNLLRYDIAYNKGEIGCISESMVTEGVNKLTEGMNYLTGYDTTYNPEDKDSHKQYTFQFIKKTLEYYRLGSSIENIIEIIIFDSIIGNGDRHQENWGIITVYNDVIKTLEEIAKKEKKGFIEKQLFSLLAITSKAKRSEVDKLVLDYRLMMPGEFSKIYDSGSCLGREIMDEKLKQLQSDDNMMEAYIRRGVSEIHWEGVKLNHFKLIEKIKTDYSNLVTDIISSVQEKYQHESINKIIMDIDSKLPKELSRFILPLERKKFIIKLITLRAKKLFVLK